MFQDRNKELHRLEQALWEEEQNPISVAEDVLPEDEDLLAEDVLDTLLEDIAPGKESVPYQNYSNNYGNIYNTDMTDEDPEVYSEEILEDTEEKTPSYNRLIILACLLAMGILGMVIYMLLKSGGIL